MGRLLIAAGAVAGAFAVVFGALFAFDGPLEASASAVFGSYFLIALVVALLASDGATSPRTGAG